MKIPAGCKTPNRSRDGYSLNSADIRFMTKAAKQIWDMLCYYSAMPENETGELTTKDPGGKFDDLWILMSDIMTELGEVRYTD